MSRVTLNQQDIDGRPDDWNRMEFETCDPKRTMTAVIQNAIGDAERAALEQERDLLKVEVDCPLCGLSWPTHELPTHVGGFLCSSLLVDQAVVDVIGNATDDERNAARALTAVDQLARSKDEDTANMGRMLAAMLREGASLRAA